MVSIRKFRKIVLVSTRMEYWSNYSIRFEISNIRTALVLGWGLCLVWKHESHFLTTHWKQLTFNDLSLTNMLLQNTATLNLWGRLTVFHLTMVGYRVKFSGIGHNGLSEEQLGQM